MNKIKVILLIMLFSSCSIMKQKNEYGIISTKEVKTGDVLKLSGKKIEEEKCLYFIFGFIPVGSFSLNNLTNRVNEITEQEKLDALANVTITNSANFFFPLYLNVCNEIKAEGMVRGY